MKAAAAFVCLFFLAACSGRPLAEGERALAKDIFRADLDVSKVRVKSGFRGAPDVALKKPPPQAPLAPRPGVCDRVAPNEGPRDFPPGWALYNTVHFSKEFYRNDTAEDWPNSVLLPQSLILTHELVHVWQWQNRHRTGYRPARAAFESVLNADPYFYVPDAGSGFLEYGFEQQASLVEDYMCYGLFDPDNPRRAELRSLLAPHFRMDRFDAVLAQP